jgi:hypothetical protein
MPAMGNLTRPLLITIFVLTFGTAFGQDFSYPNIKLTGGDMNSFIPNGWALLDSAQGDLNKDNYNDIALIIQFKDSISVVKKIFDDNDTVITQPRVLLILFYSPVSNKYQLAKQSNTFVLNHDNPNMEDPYQDISINNGVLKIGFRIFMNVVGWYMSNYTYKFRFQDNDFVLVGADDNSVNRGSGETEDRSYNFLMKKIKVATGTIESDEQKIIWRAVDLSELKTLKTFTQPFTWEVEKDYYL